MSQTHVVTPVLRPIGTLGRVVLDVIHYLGGMGLLLLAAARSIARPGETDAPLRKAVVPQLDRTLRFGLPLVAIVHVGLGSFLAMQAYFGATFYDGIGPVVGVGLVRNVAPLMSAMVLVGLLAGTLTAELRGEGRDALDLDPSWRPDRSPAGPTSTPTGPSPGRLAAARLIAGALAGPLLGAWGALVGIAVGFGVASGLLKVTVPGFFDLFLQMLWARDVVGVVVKGVGFGLVAAWFPCHEGLRRPLGARPNPAMTPGVAVRAACLAGLAVLVMNSAWFLLFYHAGPAFGPTVLAPPQL